MHVPLTHATAIVRTYLLLRSLPLSDEDVAAKILIDAGANLNAKNHKGATPMIIAAVKGHVSVLKLLANHPNIQMTEQVQCLVYTLQWDFPSYCIHFNFVEISSNFTTCIRPPAAIASNLMYGGSSSKTLPISLRLLMLTEIHSLPFFLLPLSPFPLPFFSPFSLASFTVPRMLMGTQHFTVLS